MSAASLTVAPRVYPGTYALRDDVGWEYSIQDEFQTLSSGEASDGDYFHGWIYVPEIPDHGDLKACNSSLSQLLPHNVTHHVDLPKPHLDTIALAPWTTPRCTLAYLDQASADGHVQAFFFYRPGESGGTPPPPGDSAWDLDDDGRWRRTTRYPVYAMSSLSGSNLMRELANYSGNLSTTRKADLVKQYLHPPAVIRVYGQVSTHLPANNLPSLWVFLLIILAVLIVIMGSTSSFMHITQRRRRRDLERRVAAGRVDLQTLGVKSVTVPTETLQKFPIETYNPDGAAGDDQEKSPGFPRPPSPTQHPSATPTANDTAAVASNIPLPVSPADESSLAHSPSHSTCAICLDDFEPQKTQIRILPCRHAFHPDCIDSFLLESSCLCPLCKQSVLPKGYVPPITNYMVRRERLLRRMQAQREEGIQMQQADGSVPPPPRPGGVDRDVFLRDPRRQGDLRRLSTMGLLGPRFARPPRRTSTAMANGTGPATSSPQHREWARQRAAALLGLSSADRPASEEEDPRPRWRRAVGVIFPSSR